MALQDEILQEIKNSEYSYYAIRVSGNPASAGNMAEQSRRWYDGNPINAYEWVSEDDTENLEASGYKRVDKNSAEMMRDGGGYWGDGDVLMVNWESYELINGTCCVEIVEGDVENALTLSKKYNGQYLILIAGDSSEEGNDRGEAIVNEATVVKCWRI